jgi:hypothetical protein
MEFAIATIVAAACLLAGYGIGRKAGRKAEQERTNYWKEVAGSSMDTAIVNGINSGAIYLLTTRGGGIQEVRVCEESVYWSRDLRTAYRECLHAAEKRAEGVLTVAADLRSLSA